jgi:hypothetical protein
MGRGRKGILPPWLNRGLLCQQTWVGCEYTKDAKRQAGRRASGQGRLCSGKATTGHAVALRLQCGKNSPQKVPRSWRETSSALVPGACSRQSFLAFRPGKNPRPLIRSQNGWLTSKPTPPGALSRLGWCDALHLLLKQQQGRQSLPMSEGRHMPLTDWPAQKLLNLWPCHRCGVTDATKADVCPHPMDIGFLRG